MNDEEWKRWARESNKEKQGDGTDRNELEWSSHSTNTCKMKNTGWLRQNPWGISQEVYILIMMNEIEMTVKLSDLHLIRIVWPEHKYIYLLS